MYQTSTFSNTSSLSGPTWFRSQDWLTLNDGKEDDNDEKEESDVKEDPVGFVNVPICWLDLITCKTQREAASVNLFFWDNVTNFWCNLTQNDAKHCSARLCAGRRSGGGRGLSTISTLTHLQLKEWDSSVDQSFPFLFTHFCFTGLPRAHTSILLFKQIWSSSNSNIRWQRSQLLSTLNELKNFALQFTDNCFDFVCLDLNTNTAQYLFHMAASM